MNNSTAVYPDSNMIDTRNSNLVKDLEEELAKLQSSTKTVVQQSWEEVESLQKKCSDYATLTSSLEASLKAEKEQSDYWRMRFFEAEEKLKSTSRPQLSRMSSIRKTLTSITTQQTCSSSTLASEDDMTLDMQSSYIADHEIPAQCNVISPLTEDIKEMELKIESREKAIESLEQTVSQHVDAMQNMQSEMQCMAVTHRIKQKRIADSFSGKIDHLEKVVKALRKKCENKESSVNMYQQKLLDYRTYIEELTEELGNLLGVFQILQSKGIPLDVSETVKKSRNVRCGIQDMVSRGPPISID